MTEAAKRSVDWIFSDLVPPQGFAMVYVSYLKIAGEKPLADLVIFKDGTVAEIFDVSAGRDKPAKPISITDPTWAYQGMSVNELIADTINCKDNPGIHRVSLESVLGKAASDVQPRPS